MKKVLLYPILIIVLILFVAFLASYKSDIPVDDLKSKYANNASQFMDLNGLSVHYRIEGSGPPLVLIHGTAASLHTWDGWVENLKDSHQIIRMDLPAFGLTGPNKENQYSIPNYVAFVDQFLENLDIHEFYLGGNSLGGNIAWSYTSMYPEKVKKLILVDASGMPIKKVTLVFKIARNPIGKWLLERVLPRIFIEKNVEQVFFDDSKITDELINRYYDMALRAGNRDAYISRARVNFAQTEPDLSKIKCPTLILWGKHDEWVPVNDAFAFHKGLEDSKLIIYDNAGHVPMEELPDQTAMDCEEFLLL